MEKQVTSQNPADESCVTKNEPSELTPSQIPNDKKDNQVDEPEPELNENISTKNNSDNHFGDASEERQDKPESTTQHTQQLDDRSNDVENIGPTTPEASQTEEPQVTSEFSEGITQSANTNEDRSCENLGSDPAPCQEQTVTADTGHECVPFENSAPTEKESKPSEASEFSEGITQSANTNEDRSCENLGSDLAPCQEQTVTAATALSSQGVDCSDTIQDESCVTKNEPSELTPSQIPNDKKDNQVDEPEPELNENISTKNNSDNHFGDASEERQDKPESTTQHTQQLDDRSNDVENIGPTTPEASQTEEPQVTSGSGKFWLAVAIIMAIIAFGLQHFLQPESPPQTNDVRQIDVFLRQLEKVKTRFPNQRAELWNRSRIHLKRHLQTPQPTEPVSLILTAGLRAEKTLNCLARDLASAYSSARNASVLHIDGASKASQDSDQVKLDIDRKLQGAFEGDKPVAVIHRFEELPPGSTLIFYRYCDHENAVYKNTFLIFTVLLGEEDEIPAKISLCAVEEMVDDHLQKKFLTHGHPVSFDSTVHHIFPGPYLDKYGGLWSRISHLILPVAAEERIELEGC
ncbi:torsin-1A-interacting protein 2-like isoform X2 [Pelmatolapia mariae]|uniref:torsin-1A-interacting protein 2-like isoform X2 n=1 Tax=Pelmatolapia mariae TaxID=158779 RepID=UPI002FE52141